MRIVALSVGRPRDPRAIALHDDYAGRIRRLGVAYESRCVGEVRAGGRYSDAHVRDREAAALLDALEADGAVVALDPAGRLLTSEGLAERLERWATPRVTFVVGGPLGLGRAILGRADVAWSLTPLTLPHELARVLLAEQVYRALTILRRVPYHK